MDVVIADDMTAHHRRCHWEPAYLQKPVSSPVLRPPICASDNGMPDGARMVSYCAAAVGKAASFRERM